MTHFRCDAACLLAALAIVALIVGGGCEAAARGCCSAATAQLREKGVGKMGLTKPLFRGTC
jgi:hypothetical protein